MELLDGIRNRRSINFFDTDATVTDEKIEELVDLANLAPSSFNLQPWRVVVVREPERKKALRECAMNQPKAEEASVVLIMVADPDCVEENMDAALDSWVELGYIEPDAREGTAEMMKSLYGEPDSFKRILFAVKNTALFAMNLMLAARGLGLETHPMDGFDEECVKREFKIPENKRIPMLVAVGRLRQGVELLPRAFRRERGGYVGYEYYQKKKK